MRPGALLKVIGGCSVGDMIVYHSLGRETTTSKSSIVMTPPADDKDKTNSDLAECYLCQALTDSSCPQCGLASCPHHLSSHLNTDNICLPFIIKYKEGVGRYVVASRDIKPNEVRPFIFFIFWNVFFFL